MQSPDRGTIAVGHTSDWEGPQVHFIADPWASLVFSQIGPDEPVLLIGSGLSALDVILTLSRQNLTAPLLAISHRGLMPMTHLRKRLPPVVASALIDKCLAPGNELTALDLLARLRAAVVHGQASGLAWQRVLDGIRPAIPEIWARLNSRERSRFLRHVRVFWEVHRHRMAPEVADNIASLRQSGVLHLVAGTLLSAKADGGGVNVRYLPRGTSWAQTARVSWVINCTGLGAHNRHATHPFLQPLLEKGVLANDDLCLGLLTDDSGRAVNESGNPHEDLFVAGRLRKPALWDFGVAGPTLSTILNCTALPHHDRSE